MDAGRRRASLADDTSAGVSINARAVSILLATVVPKNGEAVTGVRVNEDSFSIQLQDSAGRSHSFWKSEVTKIDKQRGKSPMPSWQTASSFG